VDAELQACRDELRDRLGARCEHIAYPYGDVNDTVAERAARWYRYGHTTEFRVMTAAEAPLRLPADITQTRGPMVRRP
jgi:hypothetical protein